MESKLNTQNPELSKFLAKKFRTHVSVQGTLFLAGREDSSNEMLMAKRKPREFIFHTEMAGSPFVNIKGEPKEGDMEEAAIMCARYSRDYKKHKGDTKIHYFLGRDTYKLKSMKTGTFGVKKVTSVNVKLSDIEDFQANPAKKGQLMEFKKQNLI